MDIEGIDVGVLYGTRGRQVLMHDDMDPALASALARAHNDWTHDYCQRDPRRLKFAAQVAFHDPAMAAAEARRAVRELGAVAVIGNPNPINGRHVHDREFEPLWDTVEELGVPVGFHPTGISSLKDDIARRMLDHPNGRVIGGAARNPMELMLAFGSLAAGGVLERHPHLRCAFLEGTCGWLPWWLWRLDELWEKFGPGSEVQINALPSEYFFRQCYVATDADEKVLGQVVAAVGDDNIVVSTDYPHSDGLFPDAINEFLALESVGEKTQGEDPLGQLRAPVSAGGRGRLSLRDQTGAASRRRSVVRRACPRPARRLRRVGLWLDSEWRTDRRLDTLRRHRLPSGPLDAPAVHACESGGRHDHSPRVPRRDRPGRRRCRARPAPCRAPPRSR